MLRIVSLLAVFTLTAAFAPAALPLTKVLIGASSNERPLLFVRDGKLRLRPESTCCRCRSAKLVDVFEIILIPDPFRRLLRTSHLIFLAARGRLRF
jgi:hypothetical protein